jgi:hypothetical protein
MTKEEKKFIQSVRRRVANVAIGASTVHGAPEKTAETIRKFLADDVRKDGTRDKDALKINPLINAKSEKAFIKALNRATMDLDTFLQKEIKGEKSWGRARKCLNIFLRDFFYNRYLYDHYQLKKKRDLESWLEIPLDSHVAKGIKTDSAKNQNLPRWKTVIGLEKENSELYQCAAAKIAKNKYKTHRIHLDLVYWRQPN